MVFAVEAPPTRLSGALDSLKIQSENNGSRFCRPRKNATPNRQRTCRAQSLYCANRRRPAPYLQVQGQGASRSGAIKRLRPTGPRFFSGRPEIGAHCVSFNFTNALICSLSSSARVSKTLIISRDFVGWATRRRRSVE